MIHASLVIPFRCWQGHLLVSIKPISQQAKMYSSESYIQSVFRSRITKQPRKVNHNSPTYMLSKLCFTQGCAHNWGAIHAPYVYETPRKLVMMHWFARFFIRNLAQDLVLKVPFDWTSLWNSSTKSSLIVRTMKVIQTQGNIKILNFTFDFG